MDENNKNINEMVLDKENKIKAAELQRIIRGSVKDCFEEILNGKDKGEGEVKLPTDSRIRGTERRLNLLETGIDDMSKDSLSLSRRVLNLSTDVGALDKEVTLMQKDILRIQEKAQAMKDEADRYEKRDDRSTDIKRETNYKNYTIIIGIIAAIISATAVIWSVIK